VKPDRTAVIRAIMDWHSLSCHAPGRFAPGPGHMDWASQPAPFRAYRGAASVALPLLDHHAPESVPDLDRDLAGADPDPGLDPLQRLGRLLQDALGLSAWKQFGGSRWALRMNPSSGNLHAEECHLMGGPWPGISDRPWVAHYDPLHHALEVRCDLPPECWQPLAEHLPAGSLLCCLTAIPWREAWKYGERAFRYIHHDTGHALACLDLAAAPLGWRVQLLDGPGPSALRPLFGLEPPDAPFAEWPLALAVIHRAGSPCDTRALADLGPDELASWNHLDWSGEPEALGPPPRRWPGLESMLRITEAPVDSPAPNPETPSPAPPVLPPCARPLRALIHGRRSAQAMDGQAVMPTTAFRRILARTLPGPAHRPLALLPGPARVSLLLFVHRVEGVEPGLLMLVRHPAHQPALKAACDAELAWTHETAAGADLPLFRLHTGDWRQRAADLSCGQEIAADGCF
jgi:nitroreductase